MKSRTTYHFHAAVKCVLLLLACASFSAAAQTDSSFRLTQTIKIKATDFAIDNLGFLYIVSPDNQLKKCNAKGDSVAVFNDIKRYGRLHAIDATNPLKVILFYKDYGTIVILDRFLNIRNTINLRRQNINQVQAIGQSFDNNLWIYDEQDNKLKRLGETGMVMSETVDFRLLFEEAPTPTQVIDQDALVYLYDPAKGVYVFDYFGTLKTQYPITGYNDIFVIGKNIYARNKTTIVSFGADVLKTYQWQLPPALQQATRLRIGTAGIYALKDDCIEIWQR